MPANIFSFDQPAAQTDGWSELIAKSQQQKQSMSQQLMAKALAGDPVYGTKGKIAKLGYGLLSGIAAGQEEAKQQAQAKANADQLARLYTSQALRQQADPSGYTLTPPEDKLKGGATPAPTGTDGEDPAPATGKTSFNPAAAPPVLAQAAAKHGVSPDYLAKTAWIESKFDPSAHNDSGADGLFQFVPSTAREYGVNTRDPASSADGAARLAVANRGILQQALGRDPTDAELYLAHQQGGGGAASLLSNPDAPAASIVGAKAVVSNGGRPGMTARQFSSLWTNKYNSLGGAPQQVAQADPIPAPTDEGAPLSAARGQTASLDPSLIPNPNNYDTSLLPAGVQPGNGAGPAPVADAAAAPSGDAGEVGDGEAPASAGSVTQAPAPETGPGSIGPNGGTMSAPTNMGGSAEMLPLEEGGGYAPAPPPRPDAAALAQALKQDDVPQPGQVPPQALAAGLRDEDPGTPIEAARGKFAYAGDGAIQNDGPKPGLSAPPPGYQPGLIPNPRGYDTSLLPDGVQPGNGLPPDQQPAPVKEARSRTLVGPAPVVDDGQPVGDPQANPATGGQTVLPKPKDARLAPQDGTVPTPAPKDLTPANPRQAEPVRPNQAQLTPRAAAALQVLINPNQPADVKKIAHEIFQSETEAGHEAYDKDGNRFWLVPGKKPELIKAADDKNKIHTDAKTGRTYVIDSSDGSFKEVGLPLQQARPLKPSEFPAYNIDPAYKGAVMLKPDGEISFPGKAANEVNISGSKPLVSNIADDLKVGRQQAFNALQSNLAFDRQLKALDDGAFTGKTAPVKTEIRGWISALTGTPDPGVEKTQDFLNAAQQNIASTARTLANAGHTTNMDINVAKMIDGGDPAYTEKAIREVIRQRKLVNDMTLQQHNNMVDRFSTALPEAERPFANIYRVDPADYKKQIQESQGPLVPGMGASAPTPAGLGGTVQPPPPPPPPPPGGKPDPARLKALQEKYGVQ